MSYVSCHSTLESATSHPLAQALKAEQAAMAAENPLSHLDQPASKTSHLSQAALPRPRIDLKALESRFLAYNAYSIGLRRLL